MEDSAYRKTVAAVAVLAVLAAHRSKWLLSFRDIPNSLDETLIEGLCVVGQSFRLIRIWMERIREMQWEWRPLCVFFHYETPSLAI